MLRRFLALVFLVPAMFSTALRPGIRVLMYHRVSRRDSFDQLVVSPKKFKEQMAVLASDYNVLTLEDAVSKLETKAPLPRNSVVVTFDDGYLDNLVEALPILEQYSIPATIFVTSNFCEQSQSHPRYEAEQQSTDASRLHLHWSEVRELEKHPLISIGSHTVSHAHLPRLGTSEARREIIESKEIIESQLQRSIQFFCYPNGDYFDREISMLKESSYRAAVTVSPGLNRYAANSFSLRRTEVTDNDDARLLRYKLQGAFDLPHKLLDMKRRFTFRKSAAAK